jgi:hypothetical protein
MIILVDTFEGTDDGRECHQRLLILRGSCGDARPLPTPPSSIVAPVAVYASRVLSLAPAPTLSDFCKPSHVRVSIRRDRLEITLGTVLSPLALSTARASSSHASTIDAVTPHVAIIPRSKKTLRMVKKPSCVFCVILFCKNGELLRSIMFTSARGVGLVSKYA